MIKLRDQVPSVYTSASRDFQYLSWLIDIVLNYVKHNVDSLYNLPTSSPNSKLTELLAMTLGFKVKRNYDQKQLAALVAVLPIILKYKGTQTAINTAGNALIAAAGSSGSFSSNFSDGVLEVCLPEKLVDITLFTDLLPYIVPAGITCRIINVNQIVKGYTTKVLYNDVLIAELQPELTWNRDKHTIGGMATMYGEPQPDALNDKPNFANYFDYDTNLVNVGLLDNTIIPVISETMADPNTKQSQKELAVTNIEEEEQ